MNTRGSQEVDSVLADASACIRRCSILFFSFSFSLFLFQELDALVRSVLADASARIEELKSLIQAQSRGHSIDQQAHLKVFPPPLGP